MLQKPKAAKKLGQTDNAESKEETSVPRRTYKDPKEIFGDKWTHKTDADKEAEEKLRKLQEEKSSRRTYASQERCSFENHLQTSNQMQFSSVPKPFVQNALRPAVS